MLSECYYKLPAESSRDYIHTFNPVESLYMYSPRLYSSRRLFTAITKSKCRLLAWT